MNRRCEASALESCFAAHRALFEQAIKLAGTLYSVSIDESERLRLGASCIRIAAEHAIAARNETQAIRGWSECEIGEQQVRSVTYFALRNGSIETKEYDRIFKSAVHANKARSNELLRLRQYLRLTTIV